jgi:hypothetical protein
MELHVIFIRQKRLFAATNQLDGPAKSLQILGKEQIPCLSNVRPSLRASFF